MSNSTVTPLQEEIRRLVREQPQLTCAGLMQQLQDLGWQLEQPITTPDLLESTPAWMALLSMAQSAKRPPETSPHAQLLPSGAWEHLPELVSNPVCDALVDFCNQHFKRPGLAPVPLTRLGDKQGHDAIKAAESAAKQAIRQCAPEGHPLANESFVLLMNRCLLRRTYPPQSWSEALRNNNNQHWHQDSNALFGSRPMLTIWIPLQDGAGVVCPGLETSSVAARFFSVTCGDSTPEHQRVCAEHGTEAAEISLLKIPRGHGAAFNGLTYHRTGLRNGMISHRDALLLRLCPARDAAWFPGERNDDQTIP